MIHERGQTCNARDTRDARYDCTGTSTINRVYQSPDMQVRKQVYDCYRFVKLQTKPNIEKK